MRFVNRVEHKVSPLENHAINIGPMQLRLLFIHPVALRHQFEFINGIQKTGEPS